jgi:uncharacterized protein (DUF934 family)
MPLMRNDSFVENSYRLIADDEAIPASGDILVPLARLEEAEGRLTSSQGRLGIHVPNTVKPASLTPLFNEVALISVAFPAFNDGRGFSIARRLRRNVFNGTLRSTGPLIADQYAYAKACGFDEIDLPEGLAARQGDDQWKKGASAISLSYQRGYARSSSILDRRRAAH